ncbi:MAG: Uncharacterised protein [Synechococcus sp. CC9902]|nr:MAG: Uncharacterised protein [Synechococcus sp. CC9902]
MVGSPCAAGRRPALRAERRPAAVHCGACSWPRDWLPASLQAEAESCGCCGDPEARAREEHRSQPTAGWRRDLPGGGGLPHGSAAASNGPDAGTPPLCSVPSEGSSALVPPGSGPSAAGDSTSAVHRRGLDYGRTEAGGSASRWRRRDPPPGPAPAMATIPSVSGPVLRPAWAVPSTRAVPVGDRLPWCDFCVVSPCGSAG